MERIQETADDPTRVRQVLGKGFEQRFQVLDRIEDREIGHDYAEWAPCSAMRLATRDREARRTV